MTDGQTLFAVFALLYLFECLRLVPALAWMAAGTGKSRWGIIRPWLRLKIGGGSPLLRSPVPPMSAHTAALPWLFVPEADGLRVRLDEDMDTRVSWHTLAAQADETTLQLDASTRVRLPSPALAKVWAQRLAEWRSLSPEKRRAAFLKQARLSLDSKAAERAAHEAAHRTRHLRLLATLLFVWCFGLISAVYHRFGDSPAVLAAAGGLLLLQWVQAWCFLRATRSNKALYPYRRWRALGIAFLPQLAMRAADAVSLATDAEPPHPLAWRPLLEDEKDWLPLARQFWREARYVPGWSQSEPLPPEAEAWQAFFRHEGIAETTYDPTPTATLPVCPRCQSEFQTGMTACKDCGGVELRQPVPAPAS